MASIRTEFHNLDNKFHAVRVIGSAIHEACDNLRNAHAEKQAAKTPEALKEIYEREKTLVEELEKLGDMLDESALAGSKKVFDTKNLVYRDLESSDKDVGDIKNKIHEENSSIRILIAEDESSIGQIFKTLLDKKGYLVDVSSNVSETVAKIKNFEPNIVLLDLYLDGDENTGLEVLKFLKKEEYSWMQCMVITAEANQTILDKVRAWGITEILTKPVTVDQIEAKMSRFIEKLR